MGKASRDKGQRGQRRCRAFLEGLGLRVVDHEEYTTRWASTPEDALGWDMAIADGEYPWRVQAKEHGKFPSPVEVLQNAAVGFIHLTHGKLRGRSLILIDADDLVEFAKVVAARKGSE